jgi:high-affinity iron transporter
MSPAVTRLPVMFRRYFVRGLFLLAAVVVIAVLVWQGVTAAGNPDPTAQHISTGAAVLDIGVLVFREGLECILVLSAILASMQQGANRFHRSPIAVGAALGIVATLIAWFIAVGIVSDLTQNMPALDVQAGTGLLAVIVLLIVMNWFFHNVYWTGWISMHNRKKRELLRHKDDPEAVPRRIVFGLGLLGFASVLREGVEIVLFLQSYRLQVGNRIVLQGVLLGLIFTSLVAVLNFVAHRRLPYKRMLIATGILLGGVLLVMVGEQAFEMQQAQWIPTTPIAALQWIPGWMGTWLSIYPTVETLIAQVLAAVLVFGSYFLARYRTAWLPRRHSEAKAGTHPAAVSSVVTTSD